LQSSISGLFSLDNFRPASSATSPRFVSLCEIGSSIGRDAVAAGRSIDVPVFQALQGQFHHDVTRGLWTLIEPTPAPLQQVRALFARLDRSVFLRSLDAVHLMRAKAEHFDCL